MTREVTFYQLVQGQFNSVAQIAASMDGFTVPSPYVLWMLLRLYPELCRVAVDPRSGYLLGYYLGLIDAMGSKAFIWQLGVEANCSDRGQVVRRLVEDCKRQLEANSCTTLEYSCIKGANQIALNRLIKVVFRRAPVQLGFIEDTNEVLYQLTWSPV